MCANSEWHCHQAFVNFFSFVFHLLNNWVRVFRYAAWCVCHVLTYLYVYLAINIVYLYLHLIKIMTYVFYLIYETVNTLTLQQMALNKFPARKCYLRICKTSIIPYKMCAYLFSLFVVLQPRFLCWCQTLLKNN